MYDYYTTHVDLKDRSLKNFNLDDCNESKVDFFERESIEKNLSQSDLNIVLEIFHEEIKKQLKLTIRGYSKSPYRQGESLYKEKEYLYFLGKLLKFENLEKSLKSSFSKALFDFFNEDIKVANGLYEHIYLIKSTTNLQQKISNGCYFQVDKYKVISSVFKRKCQYIIMEDLKTEDQTYFEIYYNGEINIEDNDCSGIAFNESQLEDLIEKKTTVLLNLLNGKNKISY